MAAHLASRLEKNLGGIKEMKELPGIVFVIDTRKESIAVTEARKVNVPIVAVVDTNCNPEGITFPIPGNDDAIRAVGLFCSVIADAVMEGRMKADKILSDAEQVSKSRAPEAVRRRPAASGPPASLAEAAEAAEAEDEVKLGEQPEPEEE